MRLSIVILNYNASVFLQLCVESCLRTTKNIEAEIIVADNDSTDDSIDRLSRSGAAVKIIRLDDNYGFSKGNNIAIQQAKGEFICLVNPDIILSETVFEECLAFFQRTDRLEEGHLNKDSLPAQIGFLGIKLLDGSGNFLQESKRRIPNPWNALKKLLGYSKSYYDERLTENEVGATEILVGAFLFGKKSSYDQLGGLDERYFMYGEDIDLSYTALKSGFQNYYLGFLRAIHFKGESTIKDEKYYQNFYSAMVLFYEKHYPKSRILIHLLNFALPKITRRKTERPRSQKSLPTLCVTNDTAYMPAWSSKQITFSELKANEVKNSNLVFDISTIDLGQLIAFIDLKPDATNKYRFLTLDRSAYAGSDSSLSRGELKIL